MRIYTLRKQLWLVGSLLWLGVCAALAWGWLDSPELPPVSTERADMAKKQAAESRDSASSVPDLDRFAAVWSREMQRPLYDPPPEQPPPPPPDPPPKPLNIRLLGTMLEPDRRAAMFAVAGEGISVRELGQTVNNGSGDAKILQIEADRVVLEYAGQQRVLTLETGH